MRSISALQTTTNWSNGGNADMFYNLDTVNFTDAATNGTIDLIGALEPLSVIVTNNLRPYTFSGGGTLAGNGSLTKTGDGMLTLAPTQDASTPLALGVGGTVIRGFDAKAYDALFAKSLYAHIAVTSADGKITGADPTAIDRPRVVLLLSVLLLYVAMVYGPIAAFLVELFPTRIRYTSMSLPYHIGNGWFGGFLPLIATSICVYTGNIYAGLYYPMAIAAVSLVYGLFFLHETKDNEISR